MAIHVALRHRTSYRYDRPVPLSPQVDPAAARAALPHADPELLAQARCRRSTSSTGSRIRTATTSRGSCFPRPTRQLLVDVDLVAELSVFNPFDFFLEPSAETFPFAYDPGLRQGARAVSRAAAGGSEAPRVSRRRRSAVRSPHHRLPGRSEPPARAGRQLHHPARAGRADARGDARARQARAATPLAARADPAPSRPGGALRLRLSDSAHARRQSRSTGRPAPPPTSPTSTPGPRSTSRAPAGSGSTPRPACSPAKATFRWRRRRTRKAQRRSPAPSTSAR